jgi:arylsulfatase/arylsulfatase A
MMYPDETTIAEMLHAAGYRTGIFGKWHLGDNYPLRAIDQGFEEALVHRGGGIGQPADPPGNRYFDPLLQHNGRVEQFQGYASDIFTTSAIDFIRRNLESPLFVYLAFNCPHTPLQISDEYMARYRGRDFAAIGAEQRLQSGGAVDADTTARIYGMVSNIDDNIGRLMQEISKLGLDENTIVIFLTDNGPQQNRYTAGLRGRKGTVYEGGIRVPCYIRWKGHIQPSTVSQAAAHIDITPTLLEACGAKTPEGVKLDGLSLLGLLTGTGHTLPERQFFFQWHRGNEPQLHRSFAVRGPRYKLVQAEGAGDAAWPVEPRYELFDIVADPREQTDLASKHPDVVAEMRMAYDRWFADVSATHGYAPPRIHVGTPFENPVILTRQDWRGPSAGWNAQSVGHWELHVAKSGQYVVQLTFAAAPAHGAARLKVGDAEQSVDVAPGERSCVFERVELAEGPVRLEAWLASQGSRRGAEYVEIRPVR